MEYKAKELFDKYQIPTMNGFVIDDLQELESKSSAIRYPVVVKAQVQVGGRGKAGGIKFAGNLIELSETSQSILGMNIKGHTVKKLLIVEKLESNKECTSQLCLTGLQKAPW